MSEAQAKDLVTLPAPGTWYKVPAYGAKIETEEVTRVTEHSIWIRGRRQSKETFWGAYFPTWADAHAYLTERSERELFAARRALELAQSVAGNVKGMKAP